MQSIRSSTIKEQLIKRIRYFFYRRNFHEVIVPILNEAVPLEPNLYPFSTIWKTPSGDKTMYLSMSPERGIKHLLADGISNCFAISKSFRNIEQAGSLHSPEFLMLEWYREKATYKDIMTDIEKLFMYLRISTNKKFPVFSLKELFKKYLDINLEKAASDEKFLSNYDQLFVNSIESKLPHGPIFLVDFLSCLSPLARPQNNNPIYAERFECYVNGIEIGNGNTENTDISSIKKVFESQHTLTNLPIDTEFIDSLKKMRNNSYAGVGIGIDRLAMILSNETSIAF